MNRSPVKSSNIKSIGHDGQQTLEVEFNDGGIHQYAGVDAQAYQRLINAPSIGSHLHSVIKPAYRHDAVSKPK